METTDFDGFTRVTLLFLYSTTILRSRIFYQLPMAAFESKADVMVTNSRDQIFAFPAPQRKEKLFA